MVIWDVIQHLCLPLTFGRPQKGEGGAGEKHNNPLPFCFHASQSLPLSTTTTQATNHQTCSLTFYIITGYFNFVCISMEDSDSGGLISTEDDPSEESSGSTGHAHMEKKISKLKLKLRGFQNVSKNLSPYSPILFCKDSHLPLFPGHEGRFSRRDVCALVTEIPY